MSCFTYFSDATIFDNRREFAETECSKLVEEWRFRHEVARANYLQYNRVLGNGIRIIKVMLEKTRESL